MKKIILIIILIVIIFIGGNIYQDYLTKNVKIKVKLKDNLKAEVFSKVKVKDFIESINGTNIENQKIDTTKIGKKRIDFYYTNEDNKRVPYSFIIEVVDRKKPVISGPSTLNFKEGYTGNILDNYMCGDNYDDIITCTIKGKYDTNKIGEYKLKIEAKDLSDNRKEEDITLKITSNTEEIKEISNYTYIDDIIQKHKNSNTQIGIDVSKWEGDIDFEKVKKQGVEFAYIRLGNQKEINGKYILDEKFIQNYQGFKKNNIPVGVYFYSKAGNIEEAKTQAKWVIEQLKNYDIDLEVVFDWENWEKYNEFNLSFYHLTEISNNFLDKIEKAGYRGMLYSSKYYLENVWQNQKYNVWLAHYTDETNYEGKYKIWQLCENGKIDGIEDTVDIDIMYN